MEYLVLGSARSGTTFLSEWLFGYLHDHSGCKRRLLEYFTSYEPDIKWRFADGEIFSTSSPHASSVDQRFEWLKASKTNYLIKHMVSHARPDITEYLASRYHVIAIYRRDPWKQILSYGISKNLGKWFTITPIKLQDLGLTYRREQFDYITRQMIETFAIANQFPYRTFVAYEDFVAKPDSLLASLGLPLNDYNAFEHQFAPVSQRMNHHHETNFINLEEVRDWCAEWRKNVDWQAVIRSLD